MLVHPIKTRVFREREDLFSFILEYVKNLKENSILVVTSKVVSLAEGRTVPFKNQSEKNKLIERESDFVLKSEHNLFTIKDGMVMAFAGVDESNGNGRIILLPKDSYKSAAVLQKKLASELQIKNIGVLITDSEFMPLRSGALGVALGYAGFKGIRDYVGKKDIFGRTLKMSKTNIADSLATSAVVCMGEGKEQTPLAIIMDAPVVFTKRIKKGEIVMDPKKDMYAPFFAKLKK